MGKFSAASLPDLHGRVYVITGGNAGIGKATVTALVEHGARVYMGARSKDKAETAIEDIRRRHPDADVRFLPMDLTNLRSVNEAAAQVLAEEPQLHGLINNAGIMGSNYAVTDDGFEIQFQTNYVSHWLLTYRLLPRLQETAAALQAKPGSVRIVNLTSVGHKLFPVPEGVSFEPPSPNQQTGMQRYGQSKLADILHAKELNKRYGPETSPSSGIWTAAVHPGTVNTGLLHTSTSVAPAFVLRVASRLLSLLHVLTTVEDGSLSTLFALAGPGFTAANSGAYVVPPDKIEEPSDSAKDPELATKLWTWTEEQLKSKGLL